MKPMKILLAVLILALFSAGAFASEPVADPEGLINDSKLVSVPAGLKTLGDPADLVTAMERTADYLRSMQADVSELVDNAGNGLVDDDPDDAGWDWVTAEFEHSTANSSLNLYGITVHNLMKYYLTNPTPEIRVVLDDVANHIITVGPAGGLRYAGDILFLLNYAELPGVDAVQAQTAADAIWTYRLANYGDGTAAGFAAFIRDYRGSNANTQNGIIPWDIFMYIEACYKLGYEADAAAMAEVLYQDSFMDNPGYFDFDDENMGNDPTGDNPLYHYYTLGVQGLYRSFALTGVHTAELAGLEAILLDCQYPDGAFSSQYGAPTGFNSRNYQATANAVMALAEMGGDIDAAQAGAWWLAAVQDASGAYLNSDLTHYPQVGAEILGAMTSTFTASGPYVYATADGPDPIQCSQTNNITFSYTPSGGVGLRGYELTLEVTGPVAAIDEYSFADAGLFDGFTNSYFRVINNGDDTYTINDAILGATPGLMVPGDMFTLPLVSTGNGQVDINVISYEMRDPDNNPIYGDVSGFSFTVDCTPPGSVDTFVGSPGHEKAELEWTMGDISDVAGFEIYRAVWFDNGSPYDSAYPEYDDLANDVIPGRPSSRAVADASGQWSLVHTATAGDLAWTDNVIERGIYYYEIFAFDAAGNYGPPAADPVWVMNYWLGDVARYEAPDLLYGEYDGAVDGNDITSLASFFGMTNIPLGHAGNLCDVGPTHDNSRLGIPTTDNDIDFEDLMIFAMNYEVVSAAKSDAVPGTVAYLSWNRLEDGRYVVGVNDANGMKGLRIESSDAINSVAGGSLLGEQDEMVFVTNIGSQLDANVAVMGLDKAIVGTGDLLIISAVGELDPAKLTFTARGLDNSEMEIRFEQNSGSQTPDVFSLSANYPNPFNPMTKISFSLPETQDVELTVYGLDGRKVTTLINETRAAGTHDVVWTGRDDRGQQVASGTYFYRINAGPYSQVRKMTLMK